MVCGLERLESGVLLLKGERILVRRGRWGQIRRGGVLSLDKNLMVCRGIVKDRLSRLEEGPHLGVEEKKTVANICTCYIQIRQAKTPNATSATRTPAIRDPVSRAGAGLPMMMVCSGRAGHAHGQCIFVVLCPCRSH